MKKRPTEDRIIAIGLVAFFIALAGFVLVLFDLWPGAKIIVQISVMVGAGAVAFGLLRRLIARNNK